MEENGRQKHQNMLLWRLSAALLLAIIVLGGALTGMMFSTVDFVVKKNQSTKVSSTSVLIDLNGNNVQCASTDTTLDSAGTLIARNGTAIITFTPFYTISPAHADVVVCPLLQPSPTAGVLIARH